MRCTEFLGYYFLEFQILESEFQFVNFQQRNSKKNLTGIFEIKNGIGIPLPMGVPEIGTKNQNSQPRPTTPQSLTHDLTLSTLIMVARLSLLPTWLLSHFTCNVTLMATTMFYWRRLQTIDVSPQPWSFLTRKLSSQMARPTWSAQLLACNSAVNGKTVQHLRRTLLTVRNNTLSRPQNMPKSSAMTMIQLSTGGFLTLWEKKIALFLLWGNAILAAWEGPIKLAFKCLRPPKKPYSLTKRMAIHSGLTSLLRRWRMFVSPSKSYLAGSLHQSATGRYHCRVLYHSTLDVCTEIKVHKYNCMCKTVDSLCTAVETQQWVFCQVSKHNIREINGRL